MIDDIDPRGPFFLSYRQSDGTEVAVELSWLLRAAGIPVWHDRTDLPPGDTNARLREALAGGISGATLVVTPDIADSTVVRTVELPQLLEREPNPAFLLTIANLVRTPKGGLDYTAPDALLRKPAGTLSRIDQTLGDERAGLLAIVRQVVRHRLRTALRSEPETLTVNLQTRSIPISLPLVGADLTIRTRPPVETRLPHPMGLQDLADGLSVLPEAVQLSEAHRVRISGGAHLSAAFAVGASLPSTLVGDLEVMGTDGAPWQGPSVSAPAPGVPTLVEVGHGGNGLTGGKRPQVLVYADLLPRGSESAYTRLLEDHGGTFAAWVHLKPAVAGELDPAVTGTLIGELANRIRELASQFDNAEVHLLLGCPFPVAVLLGRLMNTLRVVVYEWTDDDVEGDTDFRPRYVPALRVRATASFSPVQEVLLS